MTEYARPCRLCGRMPEYDFRRVEGEPWREYVELGCKSHRWMRVVASTVDNARYLWNDTCAKEDA